MGTVADIRCHYSAIPAHVQVYKLHVSVDGLLLCDKCVGQSPTYYLFTGDTITSTIPIVNRHHTHRALINPGLT